MKKASKTTELNPVVAARLIEVNPEVTELRIERNAAHELSGAFYMSLGNYIKNKLGNGTKVTVRAHGPRMSELYGIDGDLNTLGLHIITNRDLTKAERKTVEKAVEFYVQNITLKRTVKTGGKNRVELRDRTTYHKVDKQSSVAGILKFVVAF